MPLVRIDLSNSYSREQRLIVGEIVYSAMIDIANVPEHDKFQIITLHADGVWRLGCVNDVAHLDDDAITSRDRG